MTLFLMCLSSVADCGSAASVVADPALPGDGQAADADQVHVRAGGVPGSLQGGHHRGGEDREDPGRLRDRREAEGAPVLSDN